MATRSAGVAARIGKEAVTAGRLKAFLSRHFYFSMSLVMAALVVSGFSRTVDASLFHANPPRPLLLWFHGAAFSAWVLFFILQSALVRAHKVSVHRFVGWFGVALAAVMVPLGSVIAVVMARFDTLVLHQQGADAFMAVPFCDMIVFGSCIALAVYWRKRPEFHRRLVFIASCHLMDAALGRWDFIFNHNLFFPGLDLLIVLGIVRDSIVDGRVHKVYVYALPPVIVLQSIAVYAWRIDPPWWTGITRAVLAL